MSFISCWVFVFLFAGYIYNNFGVLVFMTSFFLAILVNAFVKQGYRIEELENKIERIINDKES
jgi:hypothetical protein